MSKIFSAQAHAKIIIAGEHAVVFGKPAIIAPVNLKMTCWIESREDDQISISVDYFIDQVSGYVSDLLTGNRDSDLFKAEVHLISIILIEVCKQFNISDLPGFNLRLKSEIPVGGFGSSTALTTVVIKAFCKFLQLPISQKFLFNLVMNAEEQIMHYRPSGADQAAITMNKIIHYQKHNNTYIIKKIQPKSSKILMNCLIIESGKPAIRTGEVVAIIKARHEINPEKYNAIFDAMAILTLDLEKSLINDNSANFKINIKKLNNLLIELGVVTNSTQKMITVIEKLGGNYLKVSGAGSIGKGNSGALFCYCDNILQTENYLKQHKIKYFKPW